MNNVTKSILTAFAGVALAVIVLTFIRPVLVSGDSMYPYLKDKDYLIMMKKAYKDKDPEYGDIVVFPRSGVLIIKRVIGKPNDTIEIRDGKVYRNHEAINDYTDSYTEPNMTVVLDKNEYFCLGDNREISLDSRDPRIGTVKRSEIKGKAVIRLFRKFGKI